MELLRDAGQKGDSEDRQAHLGLLDAANTDDLARQVRLADASAGLGAGRLDDPLKEADHDCRWAKVRDFRLEAGRDCPSALVAAVARRAEAARLPLDEQHRVDQEPAVQERLAVDPEDDDRAHLVPVGPQQDAKAVRAVPVWAVQQVFEFEAQQERELRAWRLQAEQQAAEQVREASLVLAEPLVQQNLAQRAPKSPVSRGGVPELAVARREQEQAASRQLELVAEFAEPKELRVSQQRAEPKAQGQPASGEPLWRQPPWRPFQPQPRHQRRHPARLVPESCGELSPRRPPGWSSSASSFPRRRSLAKGQ